MVQEVHVSCAQGDRQIRVTIDLNVDVIINPDTFLRDKQDDLQSFLGGKPK